MVANRIIGMFLALFLVASPVATHVYASEAQKIVVVESEFDKDYRRVKSIVKTCLKVAVLAGAAVVGWGAYTYCDEFYKNSEYADARASYARGEEGIEAFTYGFASFAQSMTTKSDEESYETKLLRISPVQKTFNVGYGHVGPWTVKNVVPTLQDIRSNF